MKNKGLVFTTAVIVIVIALVGTGYFFRDSLLNLIGVGAPKQVEKTIEMKDIEKKVITEVATVESKEEIKISWPNPESELDFGTGNVQIKDYFLLGDNAYFSVLLGTSATSDISGKIIMLDRKTKKQTELYKSNNESLTFMETLSYDSGNLYWTEGYTNVETSEMQADIMSYNINTKSVKKIKEVKQTTPLVSVYNNHMTWFEANASGNLLLTIYDYKNNKTRNISDIALRSARSEIVDGNIIFCMGTKNTLVRESVSDETNFVKLNLPKEVSPLLLASSKDYIAFTTNPYNENVLVYDIKNSKMTEYTFKGKLQDVSGLCINKGRLALASRASGFLIIDLATGKAEAPTIYKTQGMSSYGGTKPFVDGFIVRNVDKICIFE